MGNIKLLKKYECAIEIERDRERKREKKRDRERETCYCQVVKLPHLWVYFYTQHKSFMAAALIKILSRNAVNEIRVNFY